MKRAVGVVGITLAGLASLALAAQAVATGWRTDGTGVYPAARPVTDWSPAKNVLWATPMPAWSNATPAFWGDRVFVCSEPTNLLCVSATTGKILWTRANPLTDLIKPADLPRLQKQTAAAKELNKKLSRIGKQLRQVKKQLKDAQGDAKLLAQRKTLQAESKSLEAQLASLTLYAECSRPKTHKTNGYSSCTPTADASGVYAMFGTGVVAAYTLDGQRKWIRHVERPMKGWGHCTSPLLTGGKLIIHINNVYALDPATGKELWKAPSRQEFGSPVAMTVGKTPVVITAHGDVLRLSDGKALTKPLASLTYCSPVVSGDVVYFIQNGGKAFRLAPGADGGVTATQLWQTEPKKDRYYASPVVTGGRIYAITQKGILSVIDAADGKVLTEKRLALRGTTYPSITLAGDTLLVSSDSGTTMLFSADGKLTPLGENHLERFRSTPVLMGDRILIRGMKTLYCLGTAGRTQLSPSKE